MQIYLVGGAVRDALLGLPVKDRDWVVVGGTPQQLQAQGYVPVGKDFPVFLHPHSKEQYALARTERKTAPGYRGFAVDAAPDVTLEQDLARRDLTINAMAVDAAWVRPDGRFDAGPESLTDPFHGLRDLEARVLRHVSDAFREDPVRVLRVARFAARFPDFTVAPQTMELMRAMVADGEIDALVPERVWQEMSRGLMEAQPSRMFELLAECGALAALWPELTTGRAGPANGAGAGAGAVSAAAVRSDRADAPAMRSVTLAAQLGLPLPIRFACLCLHLTAPTNAADRAELIAQASQRLRVPLDCRALAEATAREQAAIDHSASLDASRLVLLLERCDAFRKPARLEDMLLACECDALAQADPGGRTYPQREHLRAVLAAAQGVQTATVAARASADGLSGPRVGDAIRAARVAAVGAMLSA